jgi:outer membrane lipoprotein-sorting protein
VNILRRLSLARLLLLCALAVVLCASVATALALALGSGPTPPPKPLAEAVRDALTAPAVEGVSANIQLTDHLLEGANLTSSGEVGHLASSPLLSGASGRLWIGKDGRVRVELQAEQGDTQILFDGHTASLYDAATNTLYRYTLPAKDTGGPSAASPSAGSHEAPSVAKIEEGISHLRRHADVSAATPTDIAGQAAYTVKITPSEGGSEIDGVELSWDAVHGVPLRGAIYSSGSPSPVIELAASAISYGPVSDSVFEFTPPPGVKIHEITTSRGNEPGDSAGAGPGGSGASGADGSPASGARSSHGDHGHPKITTYGHGLNGIAVIESRTSGSGQGSSSSMPEGLPKVTINGTSAEELATALGTLLSFERSGVRYLVLGAVSPAAVEALARGL